MKLKASILVSSVGIFKTIDMTKMKLSTAYKFRQILEEAERAIGDFESRRIKLAEQYGKLNKEKTQYVFKKVEDKEEFQAELTALLDDEFDLKVEPIPVELVDDYVTIEPASVELISWAVSGLE